VPNGPGEETAQARAPARRVVLLCSIVMRALLLPAGGETQPRLAPNLNERCSARATPKRGSAHHHIPGHARTVDIRSEFSGLFPYATDTELDTLTRLWLQRVGGRNVPGEDRGLLGDFIRAIHEHDGFRLSDGNGGLLV